MMHQSFIWSAWIVLTFVYFTWFYFGLLHQNVIQHIYQDSIGFLLYLVVLPIIYLFIIQNRLQIAFYKFIEHLSLLIASVSVVLAVIIHLIYGSISSELILGTNAFLSGLGLSWKISHNMGVIGLYTNTAHLLLLGSALALYRYSQTRHPRQVFLILLFLTAMILDGRRALAVAALIQLVILLPMLLKGITAVRLVKVLVSGITVSVLLIGSNLDWIQERFNFTDNDISSAERYAQVPALLNKIAENPLIGSGFGTVATHVRSIDRPFMYEVDFLATIMKLGAIGSLLYFGTYMFGLAQSLRVKSSLGGCLLSAGLAFFFYMGTNGNQAMSTNSAVFHIFLFLLIAFALEDGIPKDAQSPRLLHKLLSS